MSSPAKARPNPGNTVRRQQTRTAWALIAPSVLGIAIFMAVPVLIVIVLSFMKWNLLNPAVFVGFDNWFAVLTGGQLGHSLLITGLYVLLVIPLQTALGLFFAVLLTQKLPGSSLFRVIYVIPWICAPLALGIVWRWIFTPFGGALNALLGGQTAWLAEPLLALPSVAAVAIWSQVGYITLFFMAGLGAIPDAIVEAARLDGANAWQIFWQIKIPLMFPTLFFVLATSVISSFQAFDHIYGLTPDGGPRGSTDVIAAKIYRTAFEGNFDLGSASVMAVVLLVVIVIITVIQQRWFARRTVYDFG